MRFLIIFLTCLCFSPMSFAAQSTTGIVTQSLLSATGTSTLILARNELRTYLLIQNLGTATIIVKFNAAQSATEGIQIPAGGSFEPNLAPRDSVYIESSTGTQSFMLLEGI